MWNVGKDSGPGTLEDPQETAWDHDVLMRLLNLVGSSARDGNAIDPLTVEMALTVLWGRFRCPQVIQLNHNGNIAARWSDGLAMEIGPGWYDITGAEAERKVPELRLLAG